MAIKVGEKDSFPYLGDYGPVSFYKGEQKLAGYKWAEKSSQELHFDNTYNSFVEVEVDGQSYQDAEPTPDYPIEIESLNDFDVVSSVGGRNLILNSYSLGMTGSDNRNGRSAFEEGVHIITPTNNGNVYNTGVRPSVELVKGHKYTLSFDVLTNSAIGVYWYANFNGARSGGRIPDTKGQWIKYEFTYTQASNSFNGGFLFGFDSLIVGSEVKYKNLKLEKGNVATDWTPAPEDITKGDNHPLTDKINLSLSEPLRSRGNDCDRLIKDNDGLWKIERNIELIHPEDGTRTIEGTYGVLDSPIYEVLPQDYQDKLNTLKSFKGSNYVYTVLPNDDLTPTLHAKTEVKDI